MIRTSELSMSVWLCLVHASAGCYGLRARGRVPDATGVWVGDRKIAALGVRISHGIRYASHTQYLLHTLSHTHTCVLIHTATPYLLHTLSRRICYTHYHTHTRACLYTSWCYRGMQARVGIVAGECARQAA